MKVRRRRGADATTPIYRPPPWRVLVVDDEPDVHSVTSLALRHATFEGRPLVFLHAYSGAEAVQLLRREKDIAVILLDVVMDNEHDGLDVCKAVREELRNEKIRIVLRTGQAGVAPEQDVLETYDIDDYREKSDLPNEKLFTCVRTALKGYRDLSKVSELYEETLSLQRATEKVMNHLSHELRTPLAIVRAVLAALSSDHDPSIREEILERGERNLGRLLELHQEIRDIFQRSERNEEELSPLRLYRDLVKRLADEARADPKMAAELLQLKSEELEDLLRPPEASEEKAAIDTKRSVPGWLEAQRPLHVKRDIRVRLQLDAAQPIQADPRILEQAFLAIWRNAVENTPDGGLIEVRSTAGPNGSVRLSVADRGVGITTENQRHLFSGFYHTQATDLYSSRRPYEFDAGGKGLDLHRLQVWASRFGWKLEVHSERCRHIPGERDTCPGKVSDCGHCEAPSDCEGSGGSEFAILLPVADAPA